MKKIFVAFGTALILASCGNGNVSDTNGTSVESTSDSTTMNMGNQAPMGDTANQINNRAGNFPADTSNRNGDDSVSGTSPASRSTTPGSDTTRSGHGNPKE